MLREVPVAPVDGDASIFLRRSYLQAIEVYSPRNTCQHYAVAFLKGKSAVILSCQVAEINGGQVSAHQNRPGHGAGTGQEAGQLRGLSRRAQHQVPQPGEEGGQDDRGSGLRQRYPQGGYGHGPGWARPLPGSRIPLRDGDEAIAYYVGFRYDLNDKLPIYFRLLQPVIETAIGWKCKKVSFGRSALGPKADLGAKPVECHVWVRHRVPVVNRVLRKQFHTVPF